MPRLGMETKTRKTWVFVYGFMELLCVGSNPLSSLVSTRSGVGLEAVLPCEWQSLGEAASAAPYIQWQTLSDVVFERMGPLHFQAQAYLNRADVPEGVLERGNCSLHLNDIRFSDAGIYECYLVVGKTGNKRRVFIKSVQLSVFDHKSTQFVEAGQDLTLDLYTRQAETVAFQKTGGAEWDVLWQRQGCGEDFNPRVEVNNRKLIVRTVRESDEGMYKVMDDEGLALSTVRVSVQDPPEPARATLMDKRVPLESSVGMNSPSHPLPALLSMLLYFL